MSLSGAVGAADLGAKRTRGGRERLLRAATELFNLHSLAGTSLQMIADALGIRKASIYSHFHSKNELVMTLLAPVLDGAAAGIVTLESLPAEQRRPAAMHFLVDFYVEHRDVVGLVLFDRGGLAGDVNDRVDDLVASLGRLVGDGTGTPGSQAKGEGTVLGLAAIVQRRQSLPDSELRALLADVLADSSDE